MRKSTEEKTYEKENELSEYISLNRGTLALTVTVIVVCVLLFFSIYIRLNKRLKRKKK